MITNINVKHEMDNPIEVSDLSWRCMYLIRWNNWRYIGICNHTFITLYPLRFDSIDEKPITIERTKLTVNSAVPIKNITIEV